MKKLFASFLITSALLLSMTTNAQTWGTPVLADTLPGTNGDIGQLSVLLIVNGNPAIAYYDVTHTNLMYMRAADASGTSWNTPIPLDIGGGSITMMIVNGNPAIAYQDGNSDLKFVRAADASGTTWNVPVSIDAAGVVGVGASLQIVNGNPAISYYDATNQDLKYVRATDPSGTVWDTPIAIDVTPIGGTNTFLQIVNGHPAISYRDMTNGDLKYVRASDTLGTSWNTPVVVDAAGNSGNFSTLQIVNGYPAISYWRGGVEFDLKYVRATDSSGTAWSATISLDSINPVGRFSSFQIVNGNPAVSYYAETGDLKYIRASNASGTTWASPVFIDTAGMVGQFTSLQIVNGNPAISYYDVANGNLKYVRATNTSGSTWGTPASFNGNGSVGSYTSLQMVSGHPAITYYDLVNNDLKYARALDTSGTMWGTAVSIDVSGDVGRYTSLQIVNGNPAVSYFDQTNFDLKYVRASDALGTSWATPVSLNLTGNGGYYTSLNVVNGNPAFCYYDQDNFCLKYVRALDASGAVWDTSVSVDGTLAAGWYPSLQMVNGYPAISYLNGVGSDLRYTRALDSSGTAWDTAVSVDVAGLVGRFTSMQIVNGMPAISYYDESNGDLKFVRATDSLGSVWGTPVSVDVGGNVGQYTSLQTINGNPAISYYDQTNFNLKYVRALDASGITWAAPVTLDAPGNTGQYTSMVSIGGGAGIAYHNVSKGAPSFIFGEPLCNIPTVPNLSANVTTFCPGDSATLSIVSGVLNDATHWQWYSDSCGGTLLGSDTSIVVYPSTTTTYYARGEGGCVVFGTCGNITISVTPSPAITSQPVQAAVCPDGDTSFTIAASGTALGYQWQVDQGTSSGYVDLSNSSVYNGTDSATLNITGATVNMNSYIYRCVVTGACQLAAASDSAILFINQLPNADIGPDTLLVCDDELLSFGIDTSNGDIQSYYISNFITTQYDDSLIFNYNGTIATVISNVTGTNGCISSDQIILEDNSIVNMFQGLPALNDPFITLNIVAMPANVNSWYWSFGDGDTLSGNVNPTHEFLVNGNYEICLIGVNECGADSSCIIATIIGVGIEELSLLDKINVLPNPVKELLHVNNISTETEISIIDPLGRIVYNNNTDHDIAINMENYNAGLYFIQLKNHNSLRTKRIVKAE